MASPLLSMFVKVMVEICVTARWRWPSFWRNYATIQVNEVREAVTFSWVLAVSSILISNVNNKDSNGLRTLITSLVKFTLNQAFVLAV